MRIRILPFERIRGFALVQHKYFYFTTLIVTRDDVNEYMKYHAEYTKANRFKDIVCKIYI